MRELMTAASSPSAGPRGAPVPSIGAGTMLDHFEILGLLGAGGFGQVYRARDVGDYPDATAFWRDYNVMWSKDVSRSLD